MQDISVTRIWGCDSTPSSLASVRCSASRCLACSPAFSPLIYASHALLFFVRWAFTIGKCGVRWVFLAREMGDVVAWLAAVGTSFLGFFIRGCFTTGFLSRFNMWCGWNVPWFLLFCVRVFDHQGGGWVVLGSFSLYRQQFFSTAMCVSYCCQRGNMICRWLGKSSLSTSLQSLLPVFLWFLPSLVLLGGTCGWLVGLGGEGVVGHFSPFCVVVCPCSFEFLSAF
jgi:hypothetical protein